MEESEAVRERLLAGFERWNRGALGDAEALWHEDIVLEEAPMFPDSGIHRGRASCVERMRERLAFLGDVKLEVVGLELRLPFALVDVIVRGQGAVSGVPTTGRMFYVWELADDGRVLHWREFLEREPAEVAFRGTG